MADWQPIETAPRDGTEFQAWFTRQGSGWWEPRARWRGDVYNVPEVWGRVDFDTNDWDFAPPDAIPTHWMPLPPPPVSP